MSPVASKRVEVLISQLIAYFPGRGKACFVKTRRLQLFKCYAAWVAGSQGCFSCPKGAGFESLGQCPRRCRREEQSSERAGPKAGSTANSWTISEEFSGSIFEKSRRPVPGKVAILRQGKQGHLHAFRDGFNIHDRQIVGPQRQVRLGGLPFADSPGCAASGAASGARCDFPA